VSNTIDERPARILGTVTDEAGVPARKGTVTFGVPIHTAPVAPVGIQEPTRALRKLELKSDGSFAFDPLAPGPDNWLFVLTDKGETARITGIILKPGEAREVQLKVQ
jgi:hypothetical protein